jgi:hypothetical protein
LLFGLINGGSVADGLIDGGSVILGWWLVVGGWWSGGWAIDAYRQ